MDLSTIIISIIALMLFVVPIMYIKSVQKKKAQKHLNEFLGQAQAQQLQLTQHEFWDDCYGIGLDEAKQKLFYVKKHQGNEQQQVVNLAEMKSCSVSTTSREAGDNTVIEQISLRFTPRTPKAQELYLEFYSHEVNLMVSGELRTANKWSDIANESIKSSFVPNASPSTVPTV